MGYIDLHVHSTASDGTLSPCEVVTYAAFKQLDAIALTDHDTIDGIAEAQRAAKGTSVELIPGIELSCFYHNTELHLLGFYPDPDSAFLLDGLEEIRHIRMRRNALMLERFAEDGFAITLEDLTSGHPDTVITRAHFARILTEKGYTKSLEEAFRKYLQYGSRYCTRKEFISPERAMDLLNQSHAVPVIAHPMQYHMGYQEIEDMILDLKALGLAGVEVYHSSHNRYESGKLKEMTHRHHLISTGGSDFHGTNKPDIDLGVGRGGLHLSHLFLDQLKEAHNGRTISID
ncbi:MAG: PHP domain-containing protein [Hungatella sp.]